CLPYNKEIDVCVYSFLLSLKKSLMSLAKIWKLKRKNVFERIKAFLLPRNSSLVEGPVEHLPSCHVCFLGSGARDTFAFCSTGEIEKEEKAFPSFGIHHGIIGDLPSFLTIRFDVPSIEQPVASNLSL
ncbi:hypothetical protein ACJX0J_023919, partial [Zea mays]